MQEMPEGLPVKDVLSFAGPVIKSLVDTFVTPKLETLKKRLSLDYDKHYVPSEEKFSEYFHRTYKRLSILNTLVFNNSQRLLKDLYLPLTLLIEASSNKHKYKIEDFPHELFGEFDKILITDNAGMGKSTLIKKMFLNTIDDKAGIPVLVELRRLSKDKSVLQEIQEQIDSLSKNFENKLLLELLVEGGFVIFLDGYDEIPLSDREIVTKDIQAFIGKAQQNKFVLTSRPESALKSFGDFQEFKIDPLKKKEAFELLRKYDKQGVVSSLLIKKLEESEMGNLSDFLTNPLLVSLLFTAFQHKQTIPFKKHIFYRQVYDANFESHDLTKGESYTHEKYSRLETDDFHRVLRHIGFSCLRNNQRIEFSKDEFLEIIRSARLFCVDLSFQDSDFLKDLLVTVPLFTRDGNYFRWAHKSLQEYFAAQFIYLDSNDQRDKILLQMYSHPFIDKYVNVMDLYYDIDTKTFRKTILLELLKEFEEYYNTTFVTFRGTSIFPLVQERLELSFLSNPFVFLTQKPDTAEAHERLTLMISEIGISRRVSGRIGSPNSDNLLSCLMCGNPKDQLVAVLSRKLPGIFKWKDKSTEIRTDVKHSLTERFKPYFLNENFNDEFNSEDNFQEVNNLIKNSRLIPYHIDSVKAIQLLSEIKEQVEKEKTRNLML